MSATDKRVIILGAGFAGLQLARQLSRSAYDITLIDRYNYHQFQPLFYQVATARLEPSSISFPLRKIFQKKKNIHIRIGEVQEIISGENKVRTNIGDFSYDHLIIATGCTTNFFGNKQIEALAFPMKSTTEAMALRNRILLNFEDALRAPESEIERLLNIVVVGGGPTGVELSGALAEMKRNVLPKDYPDMDFSRLNVYLLEGGPVTLGPMSDASHKKSQLYLEQIGVKVWTNSVVENYDGKTVQLKDGRQIPSSNLIWAAGVTGNVPGGFSKDIIQRGNRLKVDRYNKVEGFSNIYALGDIAYMETPKYPKGHPQVANVAINQAKLLGKNMCAALRGGNWKEFEYKDPGSMATVGKRKAVVDLPKFSFQGRLAWFTWMFLHLMLILSVRNKLFIFINWAFSYFTNDTTLRLILLPTRKQIELAEANENSLNNRNEPIT
ncbi:NAD(P)/FAD-dependent oxidoreductase [Taibaiella chishuiensis]|uniref:NADH:ubiquinone reductase (non-electrogenic) n=1 Tax=Taibaiella chishuiensis TaxID=1434707 RepID=A0A2P8D4Q2_9BACT|nr:NAD(P)/FAD-dependent oxidoreductase [Taibaiella chishuiensis]PSK92190.1 NADH dehydrogenase [Taibaiella chishuiensis]